MGRYTQSKGLAAPSMRSFTAAAATLVLLVAGWNANVEALPVHSGSDHAVLGDASTEVQAPVDVNAGRAEVLPKPEVRDAPKTPDTERSKAKVENSMNKVKQALAAVNGGGSVSLPAPRATRPASVPRATTPIPSADGFVEEQPDPKHAQPMQISTPHIDVSGMIDREPLLTKPPPPEFINRDKRPGDDGYLAQNAEQAIHTAEHTLHKIDVKLQSDRDLKYEAARGAHNELLAAQQGSAATADMANAVRTQQEEDLAIVEKKMRQIKNEMVEHAGVNNKEHAKLQLQLERQKRKHAEILATAKTMGEAVDSAITKAGEIEGRARANFHANIDPNLELEHAIVAAAKAKMALEEHDKTVRQENRQEASDEKKKVFFNKVEQKGQEAIAKIKEDYQKEKDEAEEADYKQEKEAADKEAQTAATVGTIPMQATPTKQLQQEAMSRQTTEAPAAKPAPAAAPAPAPAPAPAAPATVAATVDKSAEIAAQAKALDLNSKTAAAPAPAPASDTADAADTTADADATTDSEAGGN